MTDQPFRLSELEYFTTDPLDWGFAKLSENEWRFLFSIKARNFRRYGGCELTRNQISTPTGLSDAGNRKRCQGSPSTDALRLTAKKLDANQPIPKSRFTPSLEASRRRMRWWSCLLNFTVFSKSRWLMQHRYDNQLVWRVWKEWIRTFLALHFRVTINWKSLTKFSFRCWNFELIDHHPIKVSLSSDESIPEALMSQLQKKQLLEINNWQGLIHWTSLRCFN